LPALRRRCDDAGAVLVVDAIFTGLGRLGELWPGSDVADVLCVGKALGGGLPLSAALFVRPDLEGVWDLGVEDVYTHTHGGSPLACAGALVVLGEVPKVLWRGAPAGWSRRSWGAGVGGAGAGGLGESGGEAAEARRAGALVTPVGDRIQAAPPFTLTDDELEEAFRRLSL